MPDNSQNSPMETDIALSPVKPERGGGIQSLERAAALLEAVAVHPSGMGIAELSAHVGLHTSTAFHLTKTLVRLGFLSQASDTKHYQIGPRLFMLAAGAMGSATLVEQGTPILERLSRETGEAAHLAVRFHADIALIARTAAVGMLQISERPGMIRPPHATAIGKVLLAAMTDDNLDGLLPNLDFRAYTEKTITTPGALKKEIARVRADGFAIDDLEFDGELRCIAMPVTDFARRCVAAIGISGPKWRMTDSDLQTRMPILARAAQDLSRGLGHSGARG